ncbi:L-serine ammonia-lyase [Solemya velum gill symbiont]|uniref:L-serine ammonia-lyase n=1 Tax=Solemya velum gill symbiont TaxID=2340 RepID=UPI000998A695|nr:L-serine ammonia-lyase [Solemya velum gill symbiont]OOZ16263.1 L-serine ammonia-lyase [Solemya velum gill symbiont]OOZ20714.1 L-serine ammonia-lyase [Solemya velum gill symbiont]OOZ23252.1 L-serine ammonia-lyase [Solemya velum gill symbiont]OOZ24176.1 L-serine ammonia-lyase [Solemya velum gill symbiont]OOZ26964.1 L-serine ammonia-lyase [Solemya velum gill symbiont]
MFISVLELFKVGIGPSSSHTLGPMLAANNFISQVGEYLQARGQSKDLSLRCTLKGSLAYTGKGHATDRAVTLGLHGYTAKELAGQDIESLLETISQRDNISIGENQLVSFNPQQDIIFDRGAPLPQHPNGMVLELLDASGESLLSETFFSIGGGFISTLADIGQVVAPLKLRSASNCPYPFDSANSMLQMSNDSGITIAEMKQANELQQIGGEALLSGLDSIWEAMQTCIENGLKSEGTLPGGLNLTRRAKALHQKLLKEQQTASVNDWLCAYAMAVNEENAAGHMVVTAPTNGAAGVIPAVLYHLMKHENGNSDQIREFLLTASAIGGIIKHNSSISGAEVGCQGEVGSAAAMAAAGLCAVRGGSAEQVENAAEIALEHHIGMTCDPVQGLVQVPCIERNGFGAIKAHAAASLAMHGSGEHFMPLDNCIAAMKQTGLEMSEKFKETSLGGLAVSVTEC